MDIFNSEEQEQLAHAIGLAEANTSGEIRICIERRCEKDVLIRAQECFFKLDMHQTALRNGVLIYLSTDDHQFAIIGDQGIDRVVVKGFWDLTKEKMLRYFKSGDLLNGLITGVSCVGEQLKLLFAKTADDVNELPNDIVFIDRENELNP